MTTRAEYEAASRFHAGHAIALHLVIELAKEVPLTGDPLADKNTQNALDRCREIQEWLEPLVHGASRELAAEPERITKLREELDRLMGADPAVGSPAGTRIGLIAAALQAYEEVRYPLRPLMAEERAEFRRDQETATIRFADGTEMLLNDARLCDALIERGLLRDPTTAAPGVTVDQLRDAAEALMLQSTRRLATIPIRPAERGE